MKSEKYLALIAPVPETSEYLLPGVGGAGNLALRGIAEGLHKIDPTVTVAGFWEMRCWPHVNRMVILPRRINYESSLQVSILPEVNLPGVKWLTRFLVSFFCVLTWAMRHLKDRRVILIYNYSVPPFPSVVLAACLTRSRIVPIVFDVGITVEPLSRITMRQLLLSFSECMNRFLMRGVAGAAVIVSRIQETLFPYKTSLLIDGGVSPEIIRRLFELKRDAESEKKPETTFLLAGSLCGYNGIDLALSAMECNENKRIRLVIAGGCNEDIRRKIVNAVNKDSRIEYRGRLSLDELFNVYREMDVFLNLRLTKSYDMSCFFPSKFLEALAVGRYVITTNVAHLKATYGHLCHVLTDEEPWCLANAMNNVADMSRGKRDAIGANGRKYMLEHHTWLHQMQRYVEYCRRLVDGEYKKKIGMVEVIHD